MDFLNFAFMEKIFNKLMLIATSALALISCGTKDLDVEPIPERTLKTITFTTAICDESKATFETTDDTNFIADWVDGDKVAVAMFLEGQYFGEDADFIATWSTTDEHFSASVDPTIHDDAYQYKAIYPVGTEGAIEFGTVRTQSGNDYNGNYDVMLSEEITANLSTDAEIVFPMHRQTAIAYFHLTSDIDEPLVSAELEVTGGNIAGEIVYSAGEIVAEGNSNKIIAVFGDDAPNAQDFKLWFNLLPVEEWTNLKLTIKTATKVKVITNNNGGEYKKGCLYKVAPSAKVGGWADRDGILPFDEKFDNIITGNSTASSGSSSSVDASDLLQFASDFNAVYKAGGAIRLGKSGKITTIPLALEKDFTVWALIKGWADSEKTLTVQFGDEKAEMTADEAMTGDFSWESVDFTGNVEDTQISFTTGSAVRVFIDRIYICPKGGEVPMEHNLELSAEEIVLGPTSGSQETFDVTSNFAWTSESTGSGFEFTPEAGDGDATITVTASSNGTSEVATLGTITISDGELEKTITIKQEAYVAGLKTDNLTAALLGLTEGSSYGTLSDKKGNNSDAVYAVNGNRGVSYIQLRASSPSGLVSTTSGGVVKKVKVTWATSQSTSSGRTITVYGKNTAYQLSDLYDNSKKGTELGKVTKDNDATETVEISGDYEYVGLLASGALYCDQIDITWGEGKAERELAFFNGENKVTAALEATYPSFTAPVLKDGDVVIESGVTYSSNNEDVAEVNAETGAITLKKHGEVTISASVAEDETHKAGEASYTINVSHVLSGIALAKDSAHPTELYQNTEFNFSGIKLNANYNDECVEDITSELTADDFSGYDMSTLGEQTVTITYNEKTTTYKLTILEAANLHTIDYSGGSDSNGNSVSGVAQAAEGDEVKLTVSLESGYYLTSLTVDGIDKFEEVNDNQVSFTMGDHDVAVVATFSNEYTVTFTPTPANGAVTVNGSSTGSVKIAAGATVSLAGTPADAAHVFNEWSVTPAQSFTTGTAKTANAAFVMPAQDVEVSGSFVDKPKEFVRITNLNDLTPGKYIIVNNGNYLPNISTGASTPPSLGTFTQGTIVNDAISSEKAPANAIWYFTQATGGFYIRNAESNGDYLYATNNNNGIRVHTTKDSWTFENHGTGTFAMKDATNGRYCATYTSDWRSYTTKDYSNYNDEGHLMLYRLEGYTPASPTTYTLTINDCENGNITAKVGNLTVENEAKIESGETVTITATADSGYEFSSWNITGATPSDPSASSTTITMNGNVSLGASFSEKQGGGDESTEFVVGTDFKNLTDVNNGVTKNGITVKSNTNAYYSPLRIYANNTITISSSSANITKVVITGSSNSYIRTWEASNKGSCTVNGTTMTWTSTNGLTTITFTMTASSQARITKIVVN